MSLERKENKLTNSVEKIIEKLSNKEQRISESCEKLNPYSKFCPDTSSYPVKKGLNITEIDDKVKDGLTKLSREDLSDAAACTLNIKELLCLLEYQRCSSDGKLVPICNSVHETAFSSCSSEGQKIEDVKKLFEKHVDFNKFTNDTECFSGIPKPTQVKVETTATKDNNQVTSTSEASADKTESNKKANESNDTPVVNEILWECYPYSYEIKKDQNTCFAPKIANITKFPSIDNLEMGKIEFGLKDEVKCKDTLELLKVQVDEACSCDTKLSYVRSPCTNALSAFGIHTESLVVSFRDVEYVPGIEKQLHFADSMKDHNTHMKKRELDNIKFNDEDLNDNNDPHYFLRSYYRTCNRMEGIPPSIKRKHCSRHAKLDKYEVPGTEVEMYTNFKSQKIQSHFRSGCTVLDCLNHLRYLPPLAPTEDNKSDVFLEDGSIDKNYDICKEEIKDCPLWAFSSDGISISGYPANITSYLELDIQAKPNTNRAAIIFSFKSMTRPLYEGLRFLLNGVPAMDLVYNQTDSLGYAVPLVPGKSHVARWEFIRGEANPSTSFNFAEIQSIILRDAFLASPSDTADLKSLSHLKNNMVHLPPKAPTRPGSIYSNNNNPSNSITTSIIPMMIILLTGVGIALLGVWLWKRHLKMKKDENEHSLGSYSAPLGFAERVAQFSFPGTQQNNNSRYAPLSKGTTMDTPHVELNAMTMFENHLPSPSDDEEEEEPTAFDRTISPSTVSTASQTLNHNSPETKNRDELI
ncbi:hypothetical protein K502DRAFT_324151 [Neoconidiobolus thromboides FSU 785]|nr:hypothetical protein K502DRAFT_324151 [Neoconidiobolus thromboides FSU 785]